MTALTFESAIKQMAPRVLRAEVARAMDDSARREALQALLGLTTGALFARRLPSRVLDKLERPCVELRRDCSAMDLSITTRTFVCFAYLKAFCEHVSTVVHERCYDFFSLAVAADFEMSRARVCTEVLASDSGVMVRIDNHSSFIGADGLEGWCDWLLANAHDHAAPEAAEDIRRGALLALDVLVGETCER